MTFTEYSDYISGHSIGRYNDDPLLIATLFSIVKISHVADTLKKMKFQGHQLTDDEIETIIKNDFGDLLRYTVHAAKAVGLTLDDIAEYSIDKEKAKAAKRGY